MTQKGWLYRRRVMRNARARTERWKELETMGYGGAVHGKPVRADSSSPLRQQPTGLVAEGGHKELGNITDKIIVLVSPILFSLVVVYTLTSGSPVVMGKWSLIHLAVGCALLIGICGLGFRSYYKTKYTRHHYMALCLSVLLLAASMVGVTQQDTIGTKVLLNNSTLHERKQTLDEAQRDLDILIGNQTLLRLTRAEIDALGSYDNITDFYTRAMLQSEQVSDRWNTNLGVMVTSEIEPLLYAYLSEAGSRQSKTLVIYYNNYITPEPGLEATATQPIALLEIRLGGGKESIQSIIYEARETLLK